MRCGDCKHLKSYKTWQDDIRPWWNEWEHVCTLSNTHEDPDDDEFCEEFDEH